MKYLCIIGALFVLSCQHGVRAISMRPVNGVVKPIGKNRLPTFPFDKKAEKKPEIFVRNKKVDIRLRDESNSTGSLMRINDGRNYLFSDRSPIRIGSFVDVIINSARLNKKEIPKADPADKKNTTAQAGGDEVVKALREALPDLSPADEEASVVKRLKMRVVDQLENGDVLVSYQRESQRGVYGAKVDVRARVSYEVINSDRELTTDDLNDVEWFESNQGELVERKSAGWEDEYTLRVSGFDEAKSKQALALEEKRNQIESVREKLDSQLVSLGKERRTMAKERNSLLKKQANSIEKIDELNQKITAQEEELKSLRSVEEKPSDNKDGANGE